MRPVPHGQGKYFWVNGKVYTGTVLDEFAGGEGIINFQGKDYPGQWKDKNFELVKKRGLLVEIISAPFKILGLD